MFIRVKESEGQPEVNVMIPAISSFTPNGEAGATITMLNGAIHNVGVTCRMLRHQISKNNKNVVSEEA